jgi:hypothetical protein
MAGTPRPHIGKLDSWQEPLAAASRASVALERPFLKSKDFCARKGFQIADNNDLGSVTETALENFQIVSGIEGDGVAPAGHTGLHSDRDMGDMAALPGLVAVENPGGGPIANKTKPLPGDVVTVEGFGGKKVRLHRLAAMFWLKLVAAARRDGLIGPLLLPVSGLRTMARQQELWDEALRKYGSEQKAGKWVAKPGESAHHSGRAIDCWLGTPVSSEHVTAQRRTQAWKWLVGNARRFGFYPYSTEPWHWEYNPPAPDN